MPTPPMKNESQQKFISRCIEYLINKESKTKDQAAGQCFSMWRQRHKLNAKAKKASKKIR